MMENDTPTHHIVYGTGMVYADLKSEHFVARSVAR